MSTPELRWFKSSYSDSSNGNDCVEVAPTPTTIHVRDSKNASGRLSRAHAGGVGRIRRAVRFVGYARLTAALDPDTYVHKRPNLSILSRGRGE